MHQVRDKCEHYARIGIRQVFVFDPETKEAWEWNRNRKSLERLSVLSLKNGSFIDLDSEVWLEMDRRSNR